MNLRGLFYFYNCREGRPNAELMREVHAMLDDQPLFWLGVEAVGYRFEKHKGYDVLHDTSNQSRANVVAYVPSGGVDHVGYLDLHQTWRNTEHPGMHAPRSFLHFSIEGMQVLNVHQAPRTKYGPNTRAQAEGQYRLRQAMAPWTHPGWDQRTDTPRHAALTRARLALGDLNGTCQDSGFTPCTLAAAVHGKVVDQHHVDTGVYRNCVVDNVAYPEIVNGVRLHTDHKHALRGRVVA